jgi:hypothetical protein
VAVAVAAVVAAVRRASSPARRRGVTLSGDTVTFSWAAGTQSTTYTLYVGSSVGSADLANSTTSGLSASVNNLPADGSTVYVRLWSLSNGAWSYNDYSFVTGP